MVGQVAKLSFIRRKASNRIMEGDAAHVGSGFYLMIMIDSLFVGLEEKHRKIGIFATLKRSMNNPSAHLSSN